MDSDKASISQSVEDEGNVMSIKLRSIGGGIFAFPHRGGKQSGERVELPDGCEVQEPTSEQMADADHDKEGPGVDETQNPTYVTHFTGWYVVPGLGLAAVYGAARPGEMIEYTDGE